MSFFNKIPLILFPGKNYTDKRNDITPYTHAYLFLLLIYIIIIIGGLIVFYRWKNNTVTVISFIIICLAFIFLIWTTISYLI